MTFDILVFKYQHFSGEIVTKYLCLVPSKQIAVLPLISQKDPVRVEHWNDFEHDIFSQTAAGRNKSFSVVRVEKVENLVFSFNETFISSVCLAAMSWEDTRKSIRP